MGNAVGTAITTATTTAAGGRPAATADGVASAMISENAGAFATELNVEARGWLPKAKTCCRTTLSADQARDAKVIDWLAEITADCPKKLSHNMNDQCGARCPDLARVL